MRGGEICINLLTTPMGSTDRKPVRHLDLLSLQLLQGWFYVTLLCLCCGNSMRRMHFLLSPETFLGDELSE